MSNRYGKESTLKLPKLEHTLKDNKRTQMFGKRFNSVKTRDYLNRSTAKGTEEDKKTDVEHLPTTFKSISEALPIALIKKQKALEKQTEDEVEEANIK